MPQTEHSKSALTALMARQLDWLLVAVLKFNRLFPMLFIVLGRIADKLFSTVLDSSLISH